MNTMEILLTQSYLIERDPPEKRIMRPYPPLGIMYLASSLKEKGFDVHLLDNTFEPDLKKFKSLIDDFKPKLVGISSVEISRETALEMCRIADDAGCAVVAGGCDPVNSRGLYFKAGAKWICAGEGEVTIAELADRFSKKQFQKIGDIPGLYFMDGKEEVNTGIRELIGNLDSVAFPAWSLIEMQKYIDAWKGTHNETALSVISSRGCHFRCAWCSRNVFGKSFRRRSPVNFLSEIEYLQQEFKPDYFWIADDSFTSSLKWLREFAGIVKSKELKLSYECLGRVDEITEEKAEILSKTGCRLIWFGAESGSQRVLDSMNKGIKVESISRARELIRKQKIPVGFFIMLGYPPEDKSDVSKTVELVKNTKPEKIGVSVAYPISGTEFFDNVICDGVGATWSSSGENRPIFKTRYSPMFYRFARRLILKTAQIGNSGGQPTLLDKMKLVFYKFGMELMSLNHREKCQKS